MSRKPPGNQALQSDGRPALTQAKIVAAAISLLDNEGLPALTMRRLGKELSVEAMSLYHHFRTKQALLAAVREALFDEISEAPPATLHWKDRIRAVMSSAYDLGIRHPSFVIALFDIPLTPQSISRGERDIEILRQAGFNDTEARLALVALIAQTVGALSAQRSDLIEEGLIRPTERRASFDFGLEVMLQGLEARLISGGVPSEA